MARGGGASRQGGATEGSWRKTARDVDGWLIVDKPEGINSTAVVGRARWALNARKAGHAGTLDPLATGLIAIAFGAATKIVPYAQEGLKTYRFTVRWGVATASDDREGDVVETSDLRPSKDQIEAVIPRFVGDIMQVPPIYSAIKVAGQRAYDIARKGGETPLAARPIRMEDLRLIDTPDRDHAVFEMICGKGGYVRSIARDLGRALGGCAHVATLRRLSSGGFTLDDATPFDALEALRDDPAALARLTPAAKGLAGLPEVDVDADTAARLSNGVAAGAPAVDAPVYWASHNGSPVAVLGRDGPGVSIKRVFRFASS